MTNKAPFLPVSRQKPPHRTKGTLRRPLAAYEQKSSLSDSWLILQEVFSYSV